MRRLSFILIASLPLAACSRDGGNTAAFTNRSGRPGLGETREMVESEGYRNYERPDGTFDRADFRRINMAVCQREVRAMTEPVPAEAGQRFCACAVDDLLQADDNQLRAIRSDHDYGERAHRIVMTACAPVLDGRPPNPMVAPEGEAGNAQ